MKKKNENVVIVIKGTDVMHGHRGYMPPAFRMGRHITKKDRPREKNWRNWI